MRSYLSLQAARSIGSIDSLGPRLPSIFEPARDDGSLEVIADAARADIRPDHSVSERAMKAERPMTSGRRATDSNQGWAPEENADGEKVSARMSFEERVKDSVPSRANNPNG